LAINISTIFLMVVLVLGIASFSISNSNPNLEFETMSFSGIAFADDEDEFEDDEFEEEEEHDDEEDAMEDAADAIADANEEIEKADEKIAEATDKGKETSLAEQRLEEAIAKRDMAQESFDSEDFEEAEELAEEAEDFANEARGKLIGKTQEDLEEDEDELEFEGIIASIGSNSFTLEGFLKEIFVNDETEFDEGLNSLSDLMLGFRVDVDVILSNSSLVATEIEVEDEEEIEIEVEVEHGIAKVEVEFNDQKTTFVEDFVDEDSIAEAILIEVPDLPLSTSEIMDIWDLEIEEDEDMSYTTMIENQQESIQTALDLIYELQQRIEQLEDRIQTLLEKYESGEYFGTVPEVDSEIKSYTIFFDGHATSIDDESIVINAEGEIFLENLLTINDNISKFRVTGGEISIDNTFYDIVFGKARVSSSGSSGEKDIVVLLGQVIDFADEEDDSTTLKLVINSEASLEGDFGLDPINIEVLPQSKIAGQWYLSGSGQLSLLED